MNETLQLLLVGLGVATLTYFTFQVSDMEEETKAIAEKLSGKKLKAAYTDSLLPLRRAGIALLLIAALQLLDLIFFAEAPFVDGALPGLAFMPVMLIVLGVSILMINDPLLSEMTALGIILIRPLGNLYLLNALGVNTRSLIANAISIALHAAITFYLLRLHARPLAYLKESISRDADLRLESRSIFPMFGGLMSAMGLMLLFVSASAGLGLAPLEAGLLSFISVQFAGIGIGFSMAGIRAARLMGARLTGFLMPLGGAVLGLMVWVGVFL